MRQRYLYLYPVGLAIDMYTCTHHYAHASISVVVLLTASLQVRFILVYWIILSGPSKIGQIKGDDVLCRTSYRNKRKAITDQKLYARRHMMRDPAYIYMEIDELHPSLNSMLSLSLSLTITRSMNDDHHFTVHMHARTTLTRVRGQLENLCYRHVWIL